MLVGFHEISTVTVCGMILYSSRISYFHTLGTSVIRSSLLLGTFFTGFFSFFLVGENKGIKTSNTKVFSIEETREINIMHQNWVATSTRESIYSTANGDSKNPPIGMFELVKMAMRQRPTYIVLGEIRGERIIFSLPGYINRTYCLLNHSRRFHGNPCKQVHLQYILIPCSLDSMKFQQLQSVV